MTREQRAAANCAHVRETLARIDPEYAARLASAMTAPAAAGTREPQPEEITA